MTSTTYQVTGMTCEHCARAVTRELSAVPGVSGVDVILVPGGGSAVTVTSAAPLAAETVAEALDEAGGYRLSGTGSAAGTGTGTGTGTGSASSSGPTAVAASPGSTPAAPSPRPTLPVI